MEMRVGKRYETVLSVEEILGSTNSRYVTFKDDDGKQYEWSTVRFTTLFKDIDNNRDKKYRMSFTVEQISSGIVSIIRPKLYEVVG